MAASATCLFFGSYESAKFLLNKNTTLSSQMGINFIAGMMAECVSCLLWLPIDVIKERLQVQTYLKSYHYKNSIDAFKQIKSGEGILALYKGYLPTVLSYGTFVAFNLSCYEKIKSLIRISNEHEFVNNFVVALATGSFASLLTNPLDIVKVRMQVQRSQQYANKLNFNFNYKSMTDGLATMIREEGPMSLWRGCGARVLYMSCQAAINLSMLDWLRTLIINKSK